MLRFLPVALPLLLAATAVATEVPYEPVPDEVRDKYDADFPLDDIKAEWDGEMYCDDFKCQEFAWIGESLLEQIVDDDAEVYSWGFSVPGKDGHALNVVVDPHDEDPNTVTIEIFEPQTGQVVATFDITSDGSSLQDQVQTALDAWVESAEGQAAIENTYDWARDSGPISSHPVTDEQHRNNETIDREIFNELLDRLNEVWSCPDCEDTGM